MLLHSFLWFFNFCFVLNYREWLRKNNYEVQAEDVWGPVVVFPEEESDEEEEEYVELDEEEENGESKEKEDGELEEEENGEKW